MESNIESPVMKGYSGIINLTSSSGDYTSFILPDEVEFTNVDSDEYNKVTMYFVEDNNLI